jgi:hypothetical protein
MKTNKSKFIVTLLSIIFPLLLSSPAHATVGGPTYIGNFKYNKADESIYFITNSYSGRGCPPMLDKISLVNEVVSSVISCTQGEDLLSNRGNLSDTSVIYEEINGITAQAKGLTSISLPKNNVEIDIKFVREEKLSEDDYVIKNHFVATVFQNGRKIDEFPLTGCSLDQPFTFAGYSIPGFEKKIIIVSSAKTDCWEGGYVGESIHVIDEIENLDKTQVGDWKSENIPLVPNEGTRVVYEKDSISPTPISTPVETNNGSSIPQPNFNKNMIWILVIVLIVGIGLGYLLKKKNLK